MLRVATNPIVKGIALIQVLLMTAIFSILLLSAVANVRQNQHTTQNMLEAAQSQLALYSAANTLQMALLTQQWFGPESGEERYKWNFHNSPFIWQSSSENEFQHNIAVKIQDVRGLLDLRYPDDLTARFLVGNGLSGLEATTAMRQLHEAQRLNSYRALPFKAPGLFLQHTSELTALPILPEAQRMALLSVSRTHGDDFNFYNAPNTLLQKLLPKVQSDILIQLRAQHKLSSEKFTEITGLLPFEGSTFFAGRELQITLTTQNQYLWLDLEVNPKAKLPIIIRQKRPYEPEAAILLQNNE